MFIDLARASRSSAISLFMVIPIVFFALLIAMMFLWLCCFLIKLRDYGTDHFSHLPLFQFEFLARSEPLGEDDLDVFAAGDLHGFGACFDIVGHLFFHVYTDCFYSLAYWICCHDFPLVALFLD